MAIVCGYTHNHRPQPSSLEQTVLNILVYIMTTMSTLKFISDESGY